jgi:dynein heavy chain
MSITLERMFDSLLLKKVPENWEGVAYPSLKPISTWMPDLIQRVIFFKNWAQNDF